MTEYLFGIKNKGNTCFLNAALQLLLSSKNIRESLKMVVPKDEEGTKKLVANIAPFLNNLLPNINQFSDFLARYLEYITKGLYSEYKLKQQYDADEFLMKLFFDRDIFGNYMDNLEMKIYFYGSDEYENYINTSKIDRQKSLILDVKNTLHESITEYLINKTDRPSKHFKGTRLLINLKVFTNIPYSLVIKLGRLNDINNKNTNEMLMDERIFMIENFVQIPYKLKSMIFHKGDANGGHYICYKKINSEWYELDDINVSKCSNPPINYSYIYLYEREEEYKSPIFDPENNKVIFPKNTEYPTPSFPSYSDFADSDADFFDVITFLENCNKKDIDMYKKYDFNLIVTLLKSIDSSIKSRTEILFHLIKTETSFGDKIAIEYLRSLTNIELDEFRNTVFEQFISQNYAAHELDETPVVEDIQFFSLKHFSSNNYTEIVRLYSLLINNFFRNVPGESVVAPEDIVAAEDVVTESVAAAAEDVAVSSFIPNILAPDSVDAEDVAAAEDVASENVVAAEDVVASVIPNFLASENVASVESAESSIVEDVVPDVPDTNIIDGFISEFNIDIF